MTDPAPAGDAPVASDRPAPPPWKLRFLVVQLFQLPAVGLAIAGLPWPAAIWGSVVCCAGTDSGWRWRNRLLVAQAVVWLLLALSLTATA